MPGPDDLQIQTPGEPLATMTPLATAVTDAGGNLSASELATAKALAPDSFPTYTAKHKGGKRWVFLDANGDQLGDYLFIGDKPGAIAEAARLSEGGDIPDQEPTPELTQEPAVVATAKVAAVGAYDPSTLKQAVFTPDGWLCPEPPAAKV